MAFGQKSVLCLVASWLFWQPVHADVILLQPGPEGKDAYGYQEGGASLDKNFGSSTELTASLAGGWQFESFIEFDLSAIPAGGYVQSAELRLYPNEWRTWDITDLVRGWHEGTFANYGLALKASSGASIFPAFYSSDTGATDLRPTLVVTHVPEPGSIFLLLAGAIGLLA